MAFDAVVLTYLEWARLVGRGWLRLQGSRIVRVDGWSGPLSETDFDALMESAPDVGLNASDFVVAELNFEARSTISTFDRSLGRALRLDQVKRFMCFDQTAYQVINATRTESVQSAVQLFEQPSLWTRWLERITLSCSANRGFRLLAQFDLHNPPAQFEHELAFFKKLAEVHHTLARNPTYEKSKGTRAFGWVTVLAIAKEILGTQANESLKDKINKLRLDFNVQQSFFDGVSADIANEILVDQQYAEIRNSLVVGAAFAHYSYIMQRSDYKIFGYEAFMKDVEWLYYQDVGLAGQIVYKTAGAMSDELLSFVLSSHQKISALHSFKSRADAASVLKADSSKDSETKVEFNDAAALTTLETPSQDLSCSVKSVQIDVAENTTPTRPTATTELDASVAPTDSPAKMDLKPIEPVQSLQDSSGISAVDSEEEATRYATQTQSTATDFAEEQKQTSASNQADITDSDPTLISAGNGVEKPSQVPESQPIDRDESDDSLKNQNTAINHSPALKSNKTTNKRTKSEGAKSPTDKPKKNSRSKNASSSEDLQPKLV